MRGRRPPTITKRPPACNAGPNRLFVRRCSSRSRSDRADPRQDEDVYPHRQIGNSLKPSSNPPQPQSTRPLCPLISPRNLAPTTAQPPSSSHARAQAPAKLPPQPRPRCLTLQTPVMGRIAYATNGGLGEWVGDRVGRLGGRVVWQRQKQYGVELRSRPTQYVQYKAPTQPSAFHFLLLLSITRKANKGIVVAVQHSHSLFKQIHSVAVVKTRIRFFQHPNRPNPVPRQQKYHNAFSHIPRFGPRRSCWYRCDGSGSVAAAGLCGMCRFSLVAVMCLLMVGV
jgi:hypothetical protein